MKRVICHYHIFKNSGTSFDKVLTKNYGKQHLSIDGPFPYFKINQDELLKIVCNSGRQAFSSHQINLPVPASLDVLIEPVVFVRHPLLRLRSIYGFTGKARNAGRSIYAARNVSFRDWVMGCVSEPRHVAVLSNGQTRSLSYIYGRPGPSRFSESSGFEFDLHQAYRNLAGVKLLGRTECFDRDVKRFETLLAADGFEFHHYKFKPKNVTSKDTRASIEDRLANIREELGGEAYDLAVRLNRQDFELYEHVNERLFLESEG